MKNKMKNNMWRIIIINEEIIIIMNKNEKWRR